MTSITTNTAALRGLQTLTALNKSMAQNRTTISTGLNIRTAADSPSIWALGQGVSQDAADYLTIGSNLTMAKATVSVGRVGAEQAASLLGEIRGKIIKASSAGANAGLIQNEIDALKDQVSSIIGAANMGGANLLKDTLPDGAPSLSVLAGRDGGRSSYIEVDAQNLLSGDPRFGDNVVASADMADFVSDETLAVAAGGVETFDIEAGGVAAGVSYRIALSGDGAHALGGGESFEYVAREGDTSADVARALGDQINAYITDQGLSGSISVVVDGANGRLSIANNDADAADTISLSATVATGGDAGGRLAGLEGLDVTTAAGRQSALSTIGRLLENTTSAAAALGASERRIDTQNDVVNFLADANRQALGSLVDADLAKESVRMASLNAQQQLASISLSIANDNAKNRILMLFQS